jgi:DNA repair exonuclease SbcCD ATPase subunit
MLTTWLLFHAALLLLVQTLLRAKDAEIAAAKDTASATIYSSSSTVALQTEVKQLTQLLETAAEAAQQQLRQQQVQHQQALEALEAEVSQAKSAAGYYQQLAQETATSLDEVKQSLAAAEEASKDTREELKSAAAAQRARQRGQSSVLKEDEVAAVSAAAGATGASAAELAALQQQKQQLAQQVEQLRLKLAQLQVGGTHCTKGFNYEWGLGAHLCCPALSPYQERLFQTGTTSMSVTVLQSELYSRALHDTAVMSVWTLDAICSL